MTELVTDPEVLKKLTPNLDLLKAILTFRGLMKETVLHEARRIIRHAGQGVQSMQPHPV